jgi:diguanylate cyclase (GGDEF)-like protein/PAS domain S-box-containing protein
MTTDGQVRPHRVLVVEDDASTRLLVCAALEAAGFTVRAAENGRQALDSFGEGGADIVLTDVVMPQLDGFATCAELRRLPGGAQLPILMMTGLEDEESIGRAFAAGATDFITKPINYSLLGHRVRYLLRASEAMARVSSSERRLATAQRIARLGHWDWDRGSEHLSLSEEAGRILGLDAAGRRVPVAAMLERVHELDRGGVADWLEEVRDWGNPPSITHRIRGADGSVRHVREQVEAVFDAARRPLHLYGTLQDITELREAEERIRQLALIDALTGLPNRELFKDRLSRAIKLARRHGRRLALLFLDLDNFKRINDTLGHTVGDLLLQATARRLEESLRESDSVARGNLNDPFEHMARLGGDEFTVLLPDVHRSEDAAFVAKRIQESLSQPLTLAGYDVFVTPSIGIAVFPDDGEAPEVLLRNADMAMYFAKRQGKNLYRFYDATLNEAAMQRLKMESQLRRALDRGELSVHYQPQIDLPSGRLSGVEALLRWENSALGSVPPVEFIPLAEETGLIIPIGEWVLRTACAQAAAWRGAGIRVPRVAVNISLMQFVQPGFPETVSRTLHDAGLAPQALELELTETLLMQDPDSAARTLRALKTLGVQLAIDDFGTGYSSLSRLKQFPIDRLKIDRTFVRDVPEHRDDAAIAVAVIAMAESMGLKVVAEGVETQGQMEFFKARSCDEVQGYYLSRPLPVAEITPVLRSFQRPGEPGPRPDCRGDRTRPAPAIP